MSFADCRPDINNPEVLLLLGSVGVGKSAIVNTIIKAITGKHFPKAKVGRGLVASTTLAFEWQIYYLLYMCFLESVAEIYSSQLLYQHDQVQ
ncbi:hypothetical protein DPMN_137114 [Dreissena polymorpha]|uniref:G domain-containing protein n=1 Tax=Dreissena polymorpha TaxID=45954 RepID=A0A9D4G218_DREPO|nr:hypothetical protein DPMN_137114 [Dreissena polymorpha]